MASLDTKSRQQLCHTSQHLSASEIVGPEPNVSSEKQVSQLQKVPSLDRSVISADNVCDKRVKLTESSERHGKYPSDESFNFQDDVFVQSVDQTQFIQRQGKHYDESLNTPGGVPAHSVELVESTGKQERDNSNERLNSLIDVSNKNVDPCEYRAKEEKHLSNERVTFPDDVPFESVDQSQSREKQGKPGYESVTSEDNVPDKNFNLTESSAKDENLSDKTVALPDNIPDQSLDLTESKAIAEKLSDKTVALSDDVPDQSFDLTESSSIAGELPGKTVASSDDIPDQSPDLTESSVKEEQLFDKTVAFPDDVPDQSFVLTEFKSKEDKLSDKTVDSLDDVPHKNFAVTESSEQQGKADYDQSVTSPDDVLDRISTLAESHRKQRKPGSYESLASHYIVPDAVVAGCANVKNSRDQNVQADQTQSESQLLPFFPLGCQEMEEVKADGSVVKRKLLKTRVKTIVTKKITKVQPDGQIAEYISTEELPETESSDAADIESTLSCVREVVSPNPSLLSPQGMPSPTDRQCRALLGLYTDTVEEEPEVETDVRLEYETLPDERVVERKIVCTRQRRKVVKRIVMQRQGPLGEWKPISSSETLSRQHEDFLDSQVGHNGLHNSHKTLDDSESNDAHTEHVSGVLLADTKEITRGDRSTLVLDAITLTRREPSEVVPAETGSRSRRKVEFEVSPKTSEVEEASKRFPAAAVLERSSDMSNRVKVLEKEDIIGQGN